MSDNKKIYTNNRDNRPIKTQEENGETPEIKMTSKKVEYTSKDKIELIKLISIDGQGNVTEAAIKSKGIKITNTSGKLKIHDKPKFDIRPAWFQTKHGFISAYRVEGQITFVDTEITKFIENNFITD